MKISTSSWHYKFLDEGALSSHGALPTSLCPYFWTVVWRLFITFILSLFVGLLLTGAVVLPIHLLFLDMSLMRDTSLELFNVFGGISWVVGIGGFLSFAIPEAMDFVKDKVCDGKSKKDRKPSLLWEYLKAAKSKVCPIIEFTED